MVIGAGPLHSVSPFALSQRIAKREGMVLGDVHRFAGRRLAFSAMAGVRSMNEVFPLERAAEAYDRMMSGKRAIPGRADDRELSGQRSLPDVFIPQFRLGGDEIVHHADALRVMKIDDFHAMADSRNLRCPGEVDRFSDDDFRHAKLHRRAAAEMAGHQRRIENRVAVGFLPAGAGQAVDLGVGHRIVVLHAAVMPAGDDCRRRAPAPSRSAGRLRTRPIFASSIAASMKRIGAASRVSIPTSCRLH